MLRRHLTLNLDPDPGPNPDSLTLALPTPEQVYCDGMAFGLGKLADEARSTPLVPGGNTVHPPAEFKYSQLHINVIAHFAGSHGFTQPYRISLRDDAPSIDWNSKNIDWSNFARENRQHGLTCAPPGGKSGTALRPPPLGALAAACIYLARSVFGALCAFRPACKARRAQIVPRSPCVHP